LHSGSSASRMPARRNRGGRHADIDGDRRARSRGRCTRADARSEVHAAGERVQVGHPGGRLFAERHERLGADLPIPPVQRGHRADVPEDAVARLDRPDASGGERRGEADVPEGRGSRCGRRDRGDVQREPRRPGTAAQPDADRERERGGDRGRLGGHRAGMADGVAAPQSDGGHVQGRGRARGRAAQHRGGEQGRRALPGHEGEVHRDDDERHRLRVLPDCAALLCILGQRARVSRLRQPRGAGRALRLRRGRAPGPQNSGRYTVDGGKLVIRMRGDNEPIVTDLPKAGVLAIYQVAYQKQ
jgi:hypothetical protein